MPQSLTGDSSLIERQAIYLTLVRRYFSTVIDFWLCFVLVGAVSLLQLSEELVVTVRAIVLAAYLLFYQTTLGVALLYLIIKLSGH